MLTTTYDTHDSWVTESVKRIETDLGPRELKIVTRNRDGYLETWAYGCQQHYGFCTHDVVTDFSMLISRTRRPVVTKVSNITYHSAALAELGNIEDTLKLHYHAVRVG